MPADRKPTSVDLDEAARLLDALERDLARVRQGSADVDALRAEVEQLRAVLRAGSAHEDVHEGLHGIRALMHRIGDELRDDAFKGSDYATRIGRLLGL